MKKTLITLMALAGMAVAEDLTLSTGIKYTDGSGVVTIYDGYTNPNVDAIGYSSSYGHGSRQLASLTFTITLSDLYGASSISDNDVITLNSFVLKVTGTNWCQDEGRTITLATGTGEDALTYTTKLEDVHSGSGNSWGSEGYLTVKPVNWTNLTNDSVITVTIATADGNVGNLSIGSADTYLKQEYTGKVEWSGVTNVDMTDSWGNEAPMVQLNVTTAPIPEPTTATLSLLALAGLAARRRRH